MVRTVRTLYTVRVSDSLLDPPLQWRFKKKGKVFAARAEILTTPLIKGVKLRVPALQS